MDVYLDVGVPTHKYTSTSPKKIKKWTYPVKRKKNGHDRWLDKFGWLDKLGGLDKSGEVYFEA